MKVKSILITTLCTTVISLSSAEILKQFHPLLAQTNLDPILIASSRQEGILTTNDSQDKINLYTEPTLRSRITGYGVAGDRVEIINQVRSREGFTWYEIKFPSSGEVGWVRSDFIRVTSTSSTRSNQSMSWSQTGEGIFTLAGRRDQRITSVTININRNGRTELGFRLRDGRLMRFGGKLVARDPYSVVINLTNSGNADASGTVNLELGQRNKIKQIIADGQLDYQNFSIQFNNRSIRRYSNPR